MLTHRQQNNLTTIQLDNMNPSTSSRKRKTPPPDEHQTSDKEELSPETPIVKEQKKHKCKKGKTNEESTDQQDSPSIPLRTS